MSGTGDEPLPPDDFSSIELPLVSFEADVYRIHRSTLPAIHFGTASRWRFDDPRREYGVLYTGLSPEACLIETVYTTGQRLLLRGRMEASSLSRLRPAHAAALVDFTGPGLARVGADARLWSGAYTAAQEWSRAVWAHPRRPAGILYPCRHDPSQKAVAWFEDRGSSFDVVPLGGLMDDVGKLAAIADRYGLAFVDDVAR